MSRPRILIADDEQHIVSLLSMTLRRRGYEVLTADNGRKALELAGAFEIDLAVLDQNMPGMAGTELAEKLDPSVPVLMLTARPQNIDDNQTRIAAVIQKPFSPSDLVGQIQGLIGQAQPPREQSA